MDNKGGRPTLAGVPLSRCTVYLLPEQLLAAHRLGNGNVSDGIRRMLHNLAEYEAWHAQRTAAAAPAEPIKRRRHQ